MIIYAIVTEQDLVNLGRLAEQQKNLKARKFEDKVLKQTHDKKLTKTFSPITNT